MSRRLAPSLADYAVIAISPALIMLLVGSLVFFLIEVFYQGQYNSRLSFIMAMFVMAAVLIARISIERGRDYALLFAIPLGIVTALATFRFVEFTGPLKTFSPVINIGLIALVWWCADKLTWDSTVINESEDASGEGLLQTVGLDTPVDTASDKTTESSTSPSQVRSWWQRFVQSRRRPHAPGVWVIYFSLAALPIFGVGNWFVPSADLDARRYTFKLLLVYVASALGLLLTTSFLGLRRYLRQRRLEMPLEMAAVWLGTGAAMIVGVIVVCLLLPRRNAEYSITQLPAFAGSPTDLWTTEHAVGNEGQHDPDQADRTSSNENEPPTSNSESGDDQAPSSSSPSPRKPKSSGQSGQESQQSGESASQSSEKSSGKQGGPSQSKGSQSKGSQSKGSQSKGSQSKGSQSKGSQSGDSSGGQAGSQSSEKSADEPSPDSQPDQPRERSSKSKSASKQGKPGSSSQPNDSQRQQESGESPSQAQQQQDARSADKSSESQEQGEADSSEKQESNDEGGSPAESSPSSRFDFSKLPSAAGGLIGQLLKLLYWAAIILIGGFFLWKYRREVREAIQNFIRSLREWWASLFGRRGEEAAEDSAPAVAVVQHRPFASYADPFLTGMAETQAPVEVIRYSFEALEAWAREHGFARHPEQTPHEYAQSIGRHHTGIARDVTVLAELYSRCAYGKDPGSRSHVERLRKLWEQLRETAA